MCYLDDMIKTSTQDIEYNKKILITGGTGFIGTKLISILLKNQYKITNFSRRGNKNQYPHIEVIEDLKNIRNNQFFDIIINLAGANISKYWTKSYKRELVGSRIRVTQDIINLIDRLKKKPELLISASAIGYYGDQHNKILNENSKPINSFTHNLCHEWEYKASLAKTFGVRVCLPRIGIVLGKDGGALGKILPIFKLGLGGKIGDGKQIMSWVHIDDVIAAILFCIKNKHIQDSFNLTAPNPVPNTKFTRVLAKQFNRPAFCTIPKSVIKIIFGEMGQKLLLEGLCVLPKKLQEKKFHFAYHTIEEALEDIYNKV